MRCINLAVSVCLGKVNMTEGPLRLKWGTLVYKSRIHFDLYRLFLCTTNVRQGFPVKSLPNLVAISQRHHQPLWPLRAVFVGNNGQIGYNYYTQSRLQGLVAKVTDTVANGWCVRIGTPVRVASVPFK